MWQRRLLLYSLNITLRSDYRRPLLMKEIAEYCGDVVCLQECGKQEYDRYINNWMALHGYALFFY